MTSERPQSNTMLVWSKLYTQADRYVTNQAGYLVKTTKGLKDYIKCAAVQITRRKMLHALILTG